MSVLWWVLGAIGLLVVLAATLVVGALVSVLRLEGRVGSGGASGRGRWGMLGVEADTTEAHVVVRLLGFGIARRPLKRGASEPPEDEAEPEERRRRRKAGRTRLSLAATLRLSRAVRREARRMLRHLHVDRLRLAAVVASEDPAWTGEAYGVGCAVLGAVRARWPHADVRLGVDFMATVPSGEAELALRLRPVRLLPGVARVGWAYWRERRRSRARV
jgi:hypothetical protein